MTNAASQVWPVNELNEIVVQLGTGTTNVVSCGPSIPLDTTTGKVAIKLPVGFGTATYNSPGGESLFVFSHGQNLKPSFVTVQPRNAAAVAVPFFVVWDLNNITLQYSAPVSSGTYQYSYFFID